MEQSFTPTTNNRALAYDEFLSRLSLFIEGEKNVTGVLANTAAALREAFGYFWVGFYLVDGERLLLGPFQGSAACFSIGKGRGVCGQAWLQGRTLLVPDVEKFPGHIACSSLSRSEVVVPIIAGDRVVAVIDVDSDRLNAFDEADVAGLEAVARLLALNLFTEKT